MALSQVFAKAATGKVNKTTKVAIEVGGRKVRAEIAGEPTDTDFESKVDAVAKDIEQDMKARGLVKKPTPAKQPQQATQQSILGGTVFDPSRKPQTPQQPVRKPTPKEEAEQATRNVLRTKSGPEFRQAVKKQGDAINRAALADVRPSNEGNPSLVGDEGIGSVAKKLGGKDPFKQFQQVVGTAARTVGGAVSPALKLDNARDQKILDTATAELLGVPGSPEEVVLNLGLAALGPLALRVAGAALKARPGGSMRDIAEMIFSQEGRTALKSAAPEAAQAIEAAPAIVRAKFTPIPDASYNPGDTPDLVAMARTGRTQPIPGSSPELQGPSTPAIPDVPPASAQVATPPASTPIPGSSPELQGPMVPKPTQQLNRTVADASPDLTSGRNAMTNNDRVIFGLDPIDKPETIAQLTQLENARRKGLNLEEAALTNARNAVENGRILNAEESYGIVDAVVTLKAKDTALLAQIAKETDPAKIADLQAQRAMIAEKADVMTQGLNSTGTEAARTLNIRRGTLNEANDPVSLKVEAKARAGRPLTAEEDAYFDQLGIELQTLQKQLDEATAAKEAAEKAAELARAQQTTIDLSRIDVNPRRRAANAQRRQVALGNINARFVELGKEQLGQANMLNPLAYASFLKDIAPDVMVVVKTLAEDGITVLDDVVKRTKEEILRLTNGKLELKDEDIVGIIGGKYRETRTVSEQRSAVANLRKEARGMLQQEERDAVRALREAKASEKAQKNAELQAVRQRMREEDQAWKAEQARLDKERKAELATAVAEGKALTRQERAEYEAWWKRQTMSMSQEDRKAFQEWRKAEREATKKVQDARKEYAQWWTETLKGTPTDRQSYVKWWNETAPAEAERLQRQIERQDAFLAEPKLPEGRKKPTEFDENEELRIRLAAKKVERDYQLNLLKVEENKKSLFSRANDFTREAKASYDMGHHLNQGGFHLLANPQQWWEATKANMRYYFHGAKFDEKAFYREIGTIRSHEYYEQAKAAKLGVSDTGLIGPNEMRVEQTGLAKVKGLSWMPGFDRSNRAYAVFVQRLRMETFGKIAKASEIALGRKLKLSELKEIADYVNITTGKGVGETARKVSNLPLFAGGFAVSRFQQVGIPIRAMQMARTNPALARKIMGDYTKVLAGISSVIMLAKASGAEVELDPRSSKFLHVKFGDRWYDVSMGIFKPVVLATQIVVGAKDKDGKIGGADPMGTVGRFMVGKLGPAYGTTGAAITGDSFGQPTGLDNPEGLINLGIKAVAPIYFEQQWKNIRDSDMTPEQKVIEMVLNFVNLEGKEQEKKKPDPEKSRSLAEIFNRATGGGSGG